MKSDQIRNRLILENLTWAIILTITITKFMLCLFIVKQISEWLFVSYSLLGSKKGIKGRI